MSKHQIKFSFDKYLQVWLALQLCSSMILYFLWCLRHFLKIFKTVSLRSILGFFVCFWSLNNIPTDFSLEFLLSVNSSDRKPSWNLLRDLLYNFTRRAEVGWLCVSSQPRASPGWLLLCVTGLPSCWHLSAGSLSTSIISYISLHSILSLQSRGKQNLSETNLDFYKHH